MTERGVVQASMCNVEAPIGQGFEDEMVSGNFYPLKS